MTATEAKQVARAFEMAARFGLRVAIMAADEDTRDSLLVEHEFVFDVRTPESGGAWLATPGELLAFMRGYEDGRLERAE